MTFYTGTTSNTRVSTRTSPRVRSEDRANSEVIEILSGININLTLITLIVFHYQNNIFHNFNDHYNTGADYPCRGWRKLFRDRCLLIRAGIWSENILSKQSLLCTNELFVTILQSRTCRYTSILHYVNKRMYIQIDGNPNICKISTRLSIPHEELYKIMMTTLLRPTSKTPKGRRAILRSLFSHHLSYQAQQYFLMLKEDIPPSNSISLPPPCQALFILGTTGVLFGPQ